MQGSSTAAHMLGPEAHADQPRGNAAQHRPGAQQAKRQRQGRGIGGAAEDPTDHAILDDELHALDDPRRQNAPLLDRAQALDRDRAAAERRRQDIRRRDRVLDGEVDADAADRRHGVGGVADAQQPRPIPAAQAIDRDGEELDLVPVRDLADAVGERRLRARDLLAKGGEAAAPDLLGGALADDEGALPIVVAVEHHQDTPLVEAAKQGFGFTGVPREPHPQHIHGGAQIHHLEAGRRAEGRMTAVGGDDELGADLAQALGAPRLDADDAPVLLDQARRRGRHAQLELRVALRRTGEEIEKLPLRHQGDELASRGQMREISQRDLDVADLALELGTSLWGRRRNSSSRPSSWITSRVEGWIVSPRKSRRKSACFSSTTTSMPARASRKPSIIPAGPPPATQQLVRMRRTDVSTDDMAGLLVQENEEAVLALRASSGHSDQMDRLVTKFVCLDRWQHASPAGGRIWLRAEDSL